MSGRVPWDRWLCPRGESIRFDDGYPADPAERYVRMLQPHCVPLTRLLDYRCSVLLGEAGAGKSDTFEHLYELAGTRAGIVVGRFNLGEYADTSELARDIFECPDVARWRQTSGELVLFLDSLDEAIAGVRNVVGLLQRRIRELPVERLRLYISCRTAAWPETLTDHLRGVLATIRFNFIN
jgi:hypothetical protein